MIVASSADEREKARRRLPRPFFDYIDGGSYAETTLRENVSALQGLRLRQRVLRDVSQLSTTTELFGETLALPLALGPVGFAGMFARRGEAQAARAAVSRGVPFTLSTVSVCPLEEVRAAAGAPIWFQLYMIKDRAYMGELLRRAEDLGTRVLVFTVDLPVPGARYRDVRSGFSLGLPPLAQIARAVDAARRPRWIRDVWLGGRPHHFGNIVAAVPEGQAGNFAAWVHRNFDPTVTFADIAWVRERWKGAIVVKGVLDPEDAAAALEAGVDGLVVSNHGGRQLDGALPAAEALPAIVEAVGARTTVLMDGGVRSGLDVLKALALGAKGVLLGRAWAYALGADGQAGVERMLDRMRAELLTAMALTGCISAAAAGPDLLVRTAAAKHQAAP